MTSSTRTPVSSSGSTTTPDGAGVTTPSPTSTTWSVCRGTMGGASTARVGDTPHETRILFLCLSLD